MRRRCNKKKKIDVFTVCRDGFTAPRHKEGLLPYIQNRTLRVFQHTGIYREEKPGLASVNPLCLFKLPQSRKPTTRRRWQFGSITRSNLRRRRGRKDSPSERGRRCGFWSGYRVWWWWWWSRSMYGSPIVFPESAVDCEQPSRRALLHQRGRAERAATSHRVGCSPVLIEEAPGWWWLVVVGTTTLTSAEEP